jgi:hypothetical protein
MHEVVAYRRALTLLCALASMHCGGNTAAPASPFTGTSGAPATAPANAAGSTTSAAGAGSGSAGAAASSDPATTWSEIFDMMFPMATNARCIACHANPANDVGNGNLHMGSDKDSAYAALVGPSSSSSRCMQRPLVVPGQPEMSLLFIKVSESPPCGSRMPIGGTPFNAAQLEMIRSWIAAGAKND